MKRFLVVLLCLLAVFAIVSCNQEPEASTPDAKPEQHGGTVTITPASEDWGTQTGKMQFVLDLELGGQEEISFLLKLSDEVTSFQVRTGVDPYTTWLKVTDFSTLEQDDDGWYIIEIDGSDIINEGDVFAFTAYVTEQTQDIEVQIKDLIIDGDVIDFSEWNEETCVGSFLGVPAALSATITK